jgi:hypothetical protein
MEPPQACIARQLYNPAAETTNDAAHNGEFDLKLPHNKTPKGE